MTSVEIHFTLFIKRTFHYCLNKKKSDTNIEITNKNQKYSFHLFSFRVFDKKSPRKKRIQQQLHISSIHFKRILIDIDELNSLSHLIGRIIDTSFIPTNTTSVFLLVTLFFSRREGEQFGQRRQYETMT